MRQGIASGTKGTAFVVYEDVMDAKQACDKLNGFNFQNRYLIGTSRRRLPTVTSTVLAYTSQFCTISQRRCLSQKRTSRPAAPV